MGCVVAMGMDPRLLYKAVWKRPLTAQCMQPAPSPSPRAISKAS